MFWVDTARASILLLSCLESSSVCSSSFCQCLCMSQCTATVPNYTKDFFSLCCSVGTISARPHVRALTRTHTVVHFQACGLPQGRSLLNKTEMTFNLLCIVSFCDRMPTLYCWCVACSLLVPNLAVLRRLQLYSMSQRRAIQNGMATMSTFGIKELIFTFFYTDCTTLYSFLYSFWRKYSFLKSC